MSFTFPPNRVILAEKASVAGDIAKVLGTATRQLGHFVVTGDNLGTYALGHLLDKATRQTTIRR